MSVASAIARSSMFFRKDSVMTQFAHPLVIIVLISASLLLALVMLPPFVRSLSVKRQSVVLPTKSAADTDDDAASGYGYALPTTAYLVSATDDGAVTHVATILGTVDDQSST